jgi:hypothetical protein
MPIRSSRNGHGRQLRCEESRGAKGPLYVQTVLTQFKSNVEEGSCYYTVK